MTSDINKLTSLRVNEAVSVVPVFNCCSLKISEKQFMFIIVLMWKILKYVLTDKILKLSNKMEECVNQTMMPPLPTTVNKGHNSRTEKVVKF